MNKASANGNSPLEETGGITASTFFENTQTIDLNEDIPEPIEVMFVEWIEEPMKYKSGDPVLNERGEPRVRRKPVGRIALINTYVPMHLFNKLIASRQQLAQFSTLQKAVSAGGDVQDDAQFSPMLDWMYKQVLNVWKLTEPDMTEDRFKEGLQFEQVFGLFGRFFGSLLQRWQAQARFRNALGN